ncbi:MAG: 3-dehydroquinate synthase [Alphaproteobacteria bacterium]|nr:3-dehydroquinate synthase [Alphaproteobacteria bacterium]
MSRVVEVLGAGFRPYQVIIGPGLLAGIGGIAEVRPGRAVAVVSDETVFGLYGAGVIEALSAAGARVGSIVVPAGEASKSFGQLERVLDGLMAQGLDRSSLVIALGGGVIGDLAGLAAALFMRGIDFVQVPTTLLAQVDSSVGGKTAIDTPRGKNLVGAFHQPRRVLADTDVLKTLPVRQLRSGWAEMLKHGLLGDAAYFDQLAAVGDPVGMADDALADAIERSVRIKAAVVGADEKEAGARALLNLGHTFGHALEAELGFDEDVLTHGEAVALGCVLAFGFSATEGLCSPSDARRVAEVVGSAGLPTQLVSVGGFTAEGVLARMTEDKKAEGGRLTLVLARRIGEAFVARDVDAGRVRAFLKGAGAS